jgi:hypothetical protein
MIKEMNVKAKCFIAAMMMACSLSSFADQTYQATVVASVPLYDVNTVTNQCEWNPLQYDYVCQAVARPDRPFPLPVAFKTTVQMPDGTVETIRTRNRYDRGVRVKMRSD